MKLGWRIYNVLETGPRSANVLRGLAKSQAEFERAIGWMFLRGMVTAIGKTAGRKLARPK